MTDLRSFMSPRQQLYQELAADERRWHLPDELRMGVLAGVEEAELRLEAHLVTCETCREAETLLAERALLTSDEDCRCGGECTCVKARNELFWLLEEGRTMSDEAIAHLNSCEGCRDHFLEPARMVLGREVDESAFSAQD